MNENPDGFKRVAILGGGGVMGHGIALACLQASPVSVSIISRREETVEHGLNSIKSGPFGLERAVARGKMDEATAADIISRVEGTTDYEKGLAGADLIFETIPEVTSLKQEMLQKAESLADAEVVIATNTSSIMISELAARLEDPSRLVGTHWFFPSNVMPLVEVGRSELTAPDRLERVVNYLKAIGKKPVVVKDSPGFFMTRFINNYLAEAIRLVELGIAGPAEIDEMVKTGLGWPMGVFELLDASSFDAFYHAQEYLHETCGERYAVPPLARKVMSAGYLGDPKAKPGSRGGWYDFLGAERPAKPAKK
ncbi:MAG: 3-hydroxyacyl-CoA dehydrogenase NAD-binding domain-containing protein [Alphaproteobacteria bacterium]|jgi:3-hydroxybutyryl-CoA dehydrogenase|nr:3-hydroxyacyl-CoA dehydrogenase NAD-binding domain-containing protein [Alphaproteobacteria bacterium]MDP6872765.1 3-hydroxyacyl-CoA dehydrogenase NAD-binding domain-containing protein [Alphaproteobacteria bacterium]